MCITAGKGRLGGKIYIMDMFRDRVEWPELVQKAEELYRIYDPSRVFIENKASGQSLHQELKRRGLPCFPVNPVGDKYYRASAVTGLVATGMVYLPEGEEWVEDLLEECADFPESDHDDIVDALGMVLNYFKQRAPTSTRGQSILGGEKKDEHQGRPSSLPVESSKVILGRKSSIWR